jgi:hypothetical protein
MTFYLAWKQDTAALIPSESEIKPEKQVSYVHTYSSQVLYPYIIPKCSKFFHPLHFAIVKETYRDFFK